MLPGETNGEVGYLSPIFTTTLFCAPDVGRSEGRWAFSAADDDRYDDDDVNKDAGLIKYN